MVRDIVQIMKFEDGYMELLHVVKRFNPVRKELGMEARPKGAERDKAEMSFKEEASTRQMSAR